MAKAAIAQNFFERHRGKIAFAGPEQCWLWTAYRDGWGYGTVGARGKKRKAHREAYEAEHGAGSADGLVVRHGCDTPACCNPAHLSLGTVGDNNRDMMERGRHVAVSGEAHCRAKLAEGDVRTIREICVTRHPVFGQKALARRFGVTPGVIRDVVLRQTWRSVA